MEIILNGIAEKFPSELMTQLNGGIILLPDTKLHEKHQHNDLFVMGEYHKDMIFGRYIAIYYGSFMRVYGSLDRKQLEDKLLGTLKHEFTHHLESLAGERGLEIKDAKDIDEYLNRMT